MSSTVDRVLQPFTYSHRVVTPGETVLFKIGDEPVVGEVSVAILRPLIVTEILDLEKVNGVLMMTPEDLRYEWPKDHLFFRLSKETCLQPVQAEKGDGVGQWRFR